MSGFDWMWVWWVLTVAICAYKLIEAVVFRPAKMLEWPFLACAMWSYFYGYMGYQAKLNLSAYLGNGMADIGQLMALLCLIGLLAGWSAGKRFRFKPSTSEPSYPLGYCWFAGFALVLIGAAGAYSVAHAQGEGTLNYKASSAYWYLLFYVGYPGMAISLWSLLKMKSQARFILWGITVVSIILFMAPHVINARRGPLFPAIIVLLLVPPITLRRPPSRIIYCGGLALAALVMLLFLQVRAVTYNGGTWGQAMESLNLDSAAERGQDADDNEYVNNCQVIGVVYQNGKYDYGTGHLELLLHWVPRYFWPYKPGLGQGIYDPGALFDDMERATGVRLLGNSGAADGGVADSFIEYGIFSPFYWFVLSGLVGMVYAKALSTKRPWWMFSYVGFLCASHWLVSQSFPAAFVPGMYFQLVPLAVLVSLWFYRRWTAPPRRVGQRRPAAIQPQARALPS